MKLVGHGIAGAHHGVVGALPRRCRCASTALQVRFHGVAGTLWIKLSIINNKL